MMAVLLKVVLLLLFVRITVSDWRTHKIPDQWNMAICLLALLLAMTDASVSWQERVMGIFAVSIPMAVIVFFVPGSFGGGDIKFVSAVGAALGVQTVVAGSMAAILFAGGYCVYLLRKEKRAEDIICLRPVFMYGYDSCHVLWKGMGSLVFLLVFAKTLLKFLTKQFQLCFIISGFQFREGLDKTPCRFWNLFSQVLGSCL